MNGVDIEVVGRGPDLVLVHGWGMHRACWQTLQPMLAKHFTLHLVNLPGHGAPGHRNTDEPMITPLDRAEAKTAAQSLLNIDTIEQWLARVVKCTPPAGWMGWSLGGQVATLAARQHPHAVTRLMLISSNPCYRARPGWRCGQAADVLTEFSRRLSHQQLATLKRFNALQVRGAEHARQTLAVLNRCSETSVASQQTLQSGLQLLASLDVRSAIAELQVPVLVAGGAADVLVPVAALRRTAKLATQADLLVLDGAGHAPLISHAQPLAERITDFMTMGRAA